MTTVFAFRNWSGEAVDPRLINNRICAFYGIKPQRSRPAAATIALVTTAVGIVSFSGGGVMTMPLLEEFFKENPGIEETAEQCFRSIFVEEYVFTVWFEEDE